MNRDPETELALNAMRRAAKKARKRAASLDLEIPLWKDDKTIFVKAKSLLKNETIPNHQ